MQFLATIRTTGFAALALAAAASTASAQIKEAGTPAAIWADLATDLVPLEFVQPPDVAAYKAEDEANGFRPLRYGALMPVDIGLESGGVYDELADGTLVWRFKVYSPGAYSIGLEFDDFVLPEGAQVFMYDETMETVLGAFGSINNQPNGEILMEPFPGDSVIFEYQQPARVSGDALLHLGTVIYDYRDVVNIPDEALVDPGGVGDGCGLVDVNCPSGDAWEVQKRCVVRTLSGGALCSGALMNTTDDSEIGYVYTANHCGQSSNTTFRFKYQKANCNSGSAPTGSNISGCTVLTSTSTFDSRLLRINNAIPAGYNPFYAGWSRSTSNSSLALSMGHPEGGPKKISIDGNGASKGSITGPGSAWFVDWSEGYLLGGSSGGPLFDQNGRVIGPACCVSSFTCSVQGAWYGRFDKFYNSNSIAQWLDPLGTNPTTLDGFDPQNPGGGGGGGGTVPVVDSVSPSSITAVNAVSPLTVTLTGDGFTGVTSVEVDGVPLAAFPPQFTVQNNTTLVVTLLPPYDIGTKTIKVIEGSDSDTINVPITFNLTPTIDLSNSDPGFILSALPIEVYMGGLPNDTHFLLFSGSNLPSSLPGIFNAGIGNNLTNLFAVGTYVVSPTTGYAKAEFPISGIPLGTKLYFQSGSINSVLPTLPLNMSNVESGTVLF